MSTFRDQIIDAISFVGEAGDQADAILAMPEMEWLQTADACRCGPCRQAMPPALLDWLAGR